MTNLVVGGQTDDEGARPMVSSDRGLPTANLVASGRRLLNREGAMKAMLESSEGRQKFSGCVLRGKNSTGNTATAAVA